MGLGGVGGWVLIPLGAWLVSCVLLVLAHFATRSSAARRQRRWVGGSGDRRPRFFWQRVCVEHRKLLHGLGPVRLHPMSSRARWPAHRFGVLLGSREKRRGRPARVRRPAVGSPKNLARGNWHASIRGRAVTGARTDGDVGGCLGTRGARKWRLEGVKRGEIVRENVGIRVLGWEERTVFVRAREVGRREDTSRLKAADWWHPDQERPMPPARVGSSSRSTGLRGRSARCTRGYRPSSLRDDEVVWSAAAGRVYLHRCAVRSKKRDAGRGCRPKSQEGGDPRLLNFTAARWRGEGCVCRQLRLLWSDGVRLPLRGVWEQMLHTPSSKTHSGLGSRAPLGRMGRACFR